VTAPFPRFQENNEKRILMRRSRSLRRCRVWTLVGGDHRDTKAARTLTEADLLRTATAGEGQGLWDHRDLGDSPNSTRRRICPIQGEDLLQVRITARRWVAIKRKGMGPLEGA
jgi:hypothetical protein